MKDKTLSEKRNHHVRKIFKLGNNGKTSSSVITIPKGFLKTLDVGIDNKVIVSLERENNNSFVKIVKLDEKFIVKNILENKIEKRKTVTDSQEFENWD